MIGALLILSALASPIALGARTRAEPPAPLVDTVYTGPPLPQRVDVPRPGPLVCTCPPAGAAGLSRH